MESVRKTITDRTNLGLADRTLKLASNMGSAVQRMGQLSHAPGWVCAAGSAVASVGLARRAIYSVFVTEDAPALKKVPKKVQDGQYLPAVRQTLGTTWEITYSLGGALRLIHWIAPVAFLCPAIKYVGKIGTFTGMPALAIGTASLLFSKKELKASEKFKLGRMTADLAGGIIALTVAGQSAMLTVAFLGIASSLLGFREAHVADADKKD